MDKIYISPDNENIYFLDCTRINGKDEIISRKGTRLDDQICYLSNIFRGKDIVLADDVEFSGSVLRQIINKFSFYGVNVVGIISSISTNCSYEYFNRYLKYGIKTNFLMSDEVIDQICERDFYFGIAGSGIYVDTSKGLFKAPYFKPFGSPCERASIPFEYEYMFSKNCLDRSLKLWEEMERLIDGDILIEELPEKIINTNKEERVVKTLRMEMERL